MIVSLRVDVRGQQAQPVVPLNAIVKPRPTLNGYAVFVVTEQGGRQIARVRDMKSEKHTATRLP
jgi:hypothetical protein